MDPAADPAAGCFALASACTLPTATGDFEMRVYREARSGVDAIALVARLCHGLAPPAPGAAPAGPSAEALFVAAPAAAVGGEGAGAGASAAAPLASSVLLRVQDQCVTSEVFGSVRCDCKLQLDASLALLQAEARRQGGGLALALQQRRQQRRRRRLVGSEPGVEAAPEATRRWRLRPAAGDGGDAVSGTVDELAGAEGLQATAGEVAADEAADSADAAAESASAEGQRVVGLVVYLLQEGRGIGLASKIAAYALQPRGALSSAAAATAAAAAPIGVDTVDANRALGLPDDSREYGAVRDILGDLGLLSDASGAGVLVLTNNPRKLDKLRECGVKVAGRVACLVPARGLDPLAASYLRTKAERMGHDIPRELYESS